ncbi:YIP1 family protein [Bacteroidia bacterium]|nr:YIP1 family protein [Bacteroidia bacterium]
MDIINRVKNILLTPKTEWQTIETENTPHVKVFTSYVVPLALIPAIAAFIGYGLIGYSVLGVHISGIGWGIRYAIIQYVTMLGGTYLTAFVIDTLANSFGATKNLDKAYSLVAYAYTPALVGGVFYLIPAISILASLASLYSLYLLYIGLQPMMKQPAEKTVPYFIVSLVVMAAVAVVLSIVLGAILLTGAMV